VTRLGEFSPVGWLFTSASFFINYKRSNIFRAHFFLLQHLPTYLIWQKRVGLHFKHFFTSSSSHRGQIVIEKSDKYISDNSGLNAYLGFMAQNVHEYTYLQTYSLIFFRNFWPKLFRKIGPRKDSRRPGLDTCRHCFKVLWTTFPPWWGLPILRSYVMYNQRQRFKYSHRTPREA
jgi:hypothetical protein